MQFFHNFTQLFIESAPWLVLGFAVAGVIKAFVPEQFMAKHLGGEGIGATVKAAFIGAPLPLCSCGVVPAALGLRRNKASKNATVSFLVATPETGVDSIAVTYALLGPVMAVVRPVAAVCSGILSGLLVGFSDKNDEPVSETTSSGCCSKQKVEAKPACCASKQPAKPGAAEKIQQGLTFSFVDMLKDIAFWLLIGLAFAAAVKTWVPASFLTQWGSGLTAFIVMTLIGIPMYICATASTPIAAGLLMAGVSPGAVLVFMMAGPATNLGTLAIVGKELGRRSLVAYLSGVVITSYLFGWLLNTLVQEHGVLVQAEPHVHEMGQSPIAYVSAVFLLLAIINVAWIAIKEKGIATGQAKSA